MIQKSDQEKAEIKAAKQAYKRANKDDQRQRIEAKQEYDDYKKRQPNQILTGIVEGEEILPDDFPVNLDYLYVVDDDGGKVIRSDIKGAIKDLKFDLRRRGYTANNIYSCNFGKRNLF